MNIQLITYDSALYPELQALADSPASDLPPNVLLGEPQKEPGELHGLSAPEIITFAVTIGTSVGVNLFSSWLYDKIKERASSLRINNQVVPISKTEIQVAIQYHIRAPKIRKKSH